MMPVWFLSYRKNNRVAYAAVNGQTGRIVSDMPVDFGVFAKRFFIAAAVIFLILMLCTILPVSVTLLSVITSFIVTCCFFDDISSISEREKDGSSVKRRRSFSDGAAIIVFIAVISVYVIFRIAVLVDTDFVTWVNAKFFSIISIIFNTAHLVFLVLCIFEFADIRKDRTPAYVICPIVNFLAGAAGGLVLLFAPALDAWYYLAGSAVLFTEMISFLFIIKNYNRKATRPLPQFSVHKGGDDSAR